MSKFLNHITMQDIAKLSGLSRSTVYRYFQSPEKVSVEAQHKIKNILTQFYQHKNIDHKALTIAYIRPEYDEFFIDSLSYNICTLGRAQGYDIHIVSCPVNDVFNTNIIVQETFDQYDICILSVPDTPKIEMLINEAQKQKNKLIVTFVTDIPNSKRKAFVGIDNNKAGRTAGYLCHRNIIAKEHPEIVVLLGSSLQKDHLDRAFGFKNYIQNHCSQAKIHMLHTDIKPYDTAEYMLNYLSKLNNLTAIYSTPARHKILEQFLPKLQNRPLIITHEYNRLTRYFIKNNLVDFILAQNTYGLSENILQTISTLVKKKKNYNEKYLLPIDILTAENLPD